MKNTLIGILSIVLVAVVVLCVQNDVEEDSRRVVVGVTAPLSGPIASYGEAYRNGMLLALEDHALSNEQQVSFVFEDHQYDPAQAVSAFTKLVDVDGVKVVADFGAAPASAIAPLVDERDVVLITSSVDASVTRESERILRNLYSVGEIAETLWSHFRATGTKRIAILKVNNPYYNGITEELSAQAHADETVTVIDTVAGFDVMDFRTNILKLEQQIEEVDILGVFLGGGQIPVLYEQMEDQGVAILTFGTDFFESESVIADAEGRMEGAVYANIGASPEFIERYKARYGNTDQVSFAASGYDLASILIEEVDHTNTNTIMESLRKVQGVEGVVGAYTYVKTEDDRYLKSPVRMKVIRDGGIEVLPL